MSHEIFHLIDRPGRIFETLGVDEFWVQGDYEDGVAVCEPVTVDHLLVEGCFVLPRLADEPGRYPILTVGHGWPGENPDEPCFRVPSKRRSAASGLVLHLTYEPSRKRFVFGMNSGTKRAELQAVALDDASPECYTGRVLRLVVLISHDGMSLSIEDPFTEHEEIFGELALAHLSRIRIWGRPLRGNWWTLSGAEHDDDERSFPAGFGLCDLRVTAFGADAGLRLDTMPYSGALDHLVRRDLRRPTSDFPPLRKGGSRGDFRAAVLPHLRLPTSPLKKGGTEGGFPRSGSSPSPRKPKPKGATPWHCYERSVPESVRSSRFKAP